MSKEFLMAKLATPNPSISLGWQMSFHCRLLHSFVFVPSDYNAAPKLMVRAAGPQQVSWIHEVMFIIWYTPLGFHQILWETELGAGHSEPCPPYLLDLVRLISLFTSSTVWDSERWVNDSSSDRCVYWSMNCTSISIIPTAKVRFSWTNAASLNYGTPWKDERHSFLHWYQLVLG